MRRVNAREWGVTEALGTDVVGGASSWDVRVGVDVSIPGVEWRVEAGGREVSCRLLLKRS